jgi:hypothetical protein
VGKVQADLDRVILVESGQFGQRGIVWVRLNGFDLRGRAGGKSALRFDAVEHAL